MRIRTCCRTAALSIILGTALGMQAATTIQFSATSATIAESAGTVPLSVLRTGDTNTEVSVDYATADGSAINGLEYTAVLGTVTFAATETKKIIAVPILNNGFVEGAKTFKLLLSHPTDGAVLGVRTNALVSITDNDLGIQFQFATSSVIEDAGTVVIGIVRDDDGILPVTVDFFTTGLTARNGLDYTGATNTLSFGPQERLKFVSIPILNNTLKQPNRTFRVTLAKPTGAMLGSQKVETVTIVDNDQGFRFDFASYSVAEDAGVARIGVLRGTDDTSGTVTVDFVTSDMTAINGLDYAGITNTLSFAPGERVKAISVPILNDSVREATRKFSVTLTNPTGGAVVGSPKTVSVTIVDNDPGIGFELASYSVWENTGAITITVLRGNDLVLGPITANYATSDLTAKAGQDYLPISGTLAFEQNETAKTVSIPILQHGGSNTSFRVALSNPTGGAILGRTNTTISILGAGRGTYRTVAPQFETALMIERVGGFEILTWVGGGQLQKSDGPAGPWQMLSKVSSPYAVRPALPTTFYRVTRPRPANVYVPSTYDGRTQFPLVILLHEYGGSGDDVENYMQLRPFAETRGFLYCHPESPADNAGVPFWNATDACCDFFNTGRDDAGYLRAVIEEIERQFAVDRKRIHLIGWSNGGFMAYQMACQSADLIAGIASLGGMTFLDPSRCQPSQPVNILHIHGTADVTANYGGGADTIIPGGWPLNMPPYPSVVQSVQTWAGYNGASDPVIESGPSMDLDLAVPGMDTVITRYTKSPPGGAIELWNIEGATHFPVLSPEFAPRVIDWLLAHPKP